MQYHSRKLREGLIGHNAMLQLKNKELFAAKASSLPRYMVRWRITGAIGPSFRLK